MSSDRVCDVCGARVLLAAGGYMHATGPDKHAPAPVKKRASGHPVFGQVSQGTKRPSGAAALFTAGDGRS